MDPRPDYALAPPLAGRVLRLAGHGIATAYARALLDSLGARVVTEPGPADADPALANARSGLSALTGLADGPPQMCPVPLASCADGVIEALRCLSGATPARALPDGAALLGERAAIAGLGRNGAISPGGSCRLLRAADGWFALSLTREADWAAVPAWLEAEIPRSWEAIGTLVTGRPAAALVERAGLLGLAAAVSATPEPKPAPWYTVTASGPRAAPGTRRHPPRVVDLSSLWAGPLCSHLLQALGAEVVKVESSSRPDGARAGPAPFFDLMNAGKRSVALDFGSGELRLLHELLDCADIVVEASRPRALRQPGLIAEAWLAARPGRTWLSITGYGRDGPGENRVAFGDDAGVAAGLSALLLEVTGLPLFCGDAIADPLAGLHGALAAWSSYQGGGGHLLSVALRDVVAHCIRFSLPADTAALRRRWQEWNAAAQAAGLGASPPIARVPAGPARPLGADNNAALSAWSDSG